MIVHELKSWPLYFQAVFSGHKRFELRNGNRGFAVGDVLWLREWNEETEQYTGREIKKRVTYLLEGGTSITVSDAQLNTWVASASPPRLGLLFGFVIMSLEDFHG
jgi:hypothetical protein